MKLLVFSGLLRHVSTVDATHLWLRLGFPFQPFCFSRGWSHMISSIVATCNWKLLRNYVAAHPQSNFVKLSCSPIPSAAWLHERLKLFQAIAGQRDRLTRKFGRHKCQNGLESSHSGSFEMSEYVLYIYCIYIYIILYMRKRPCMDLERAKSTAENHAESITCPFLKRFQTSPDTLFSPRQRTTAARDLGGLR